MAEEHDNGVRIVDVDMPFGSMVKFMVKWAIASIPALVILVFIGVVAGGIIGGLGTALVTRSSAPDRANSTSRRALDSLLQGALPTTSSAAPTWDVSETTNPIDDSPTVILSLDAGSPMATALKGEPSLILRCKSKETNLYIRWGSFLGSDEVAVTTRIGREPASRKSWTLSTDNQASFYPGSPIGFIKQLMAADTLVAMTTPYSESPVTATFAIAGLSEKIEPLRKACGW
jgi:type VI secretion system protein VasI